MRVIRMKNKQLLTPRDKIVWSLILLFALRFFANIPTPFTDSSYLSSLIDSNGSMGFLNALTGGGLSTMSVMALSITPYITASIIMQLMGVAFPTIHAMQTGMKDERDKISRATVVLGIVLAVAESVAMAIGYGKQGIITPFKWYSVLTVVLIWTAGASVASLVGKFIQDRYDINGSSLILVSNILSSYIPDMKAVYTKFISGRKVPMMVLWTVIVVAFILAMHLFVVLVHQSEKRVTVMYSQKLAHSATASKLPPTTIPIKLCPGSVVPVIFASSVVTIPSFIQSFTKSDVAWLRFANTSNWFNPSNMIYSIGAIFYVLMIIGFSYYYTDMIFNPIEVADNLKRGGGAIPGVRAGAETAAYLKHQLKYLVFIGAIALSIIAMIPMVIAGVYGMAKTSFMGTSIIITVGVVIETYKALESQQISRRYANRNVLLGRRTKLSGKFKKKVAHQLY